MRTKKIFLNMLLDIVPYILIGLLGLFKVRVFVSALGDIGNGYYQVINQVITYVFLAQISFGDAVTFYLYKYFANDDKRNINRVFTGGRKIFKKLGILIFIITMIVSLGMYFFYNFQDGYRISVILAYLIISISYLISYFGYGKVAQAIFTADQSKYIYSSIFNTIKLFCDIFLIIVLSNWNSLIYVAIVIFFAKLIEEVIIRIVLKKKYPYLKEVKKEDTKMFKLTYDLAGITIGNLLFTNMVFWFTFIFLGASMVSVYSTYLFITRYLIEVSCKIENSVVSSFGNVLAKKEEEKIYSLFMELLILFTVIAFSFVLTFSIGIRGFVNLWIGDTSYLLSYHSIMLISAITFIRIIGLPLTTLINSNGSFRESRIHITICLIINIILSLLLVHTYKLNGLLFASLVSYIIYIIQRIHFVEVNILKEKHKNIFYNYTIIFIIFGISIYLVKYLENYFLSALNSILNAILILGIMFISLVLFIFGLLITKNKYARNLVKRCKLLYKKIRKKA